MDLCGPTTILYDAQKMELYASDDDTVRRLWRLRSGGEGITRRID